MVEKPHAPEVDVPSESARPESAEPGDSQPWWRRTRALVVVAAGFAAVLGVALLAPGGVGGLLGDREEDARTTAGAGDRRESSNDEGPRASERREGRTTAEDTSEPDPAEQRDADAPGQSPTTAPPPGGASTDEPALPNLDITPAAFRERWNVAVRDLGRGYPLDEIVVDDSQAGDPSGAAMVGYPVQQPMDAFGFIEVTVRPDGLVSSAVVEGQPAGDQQEGYVATLAAAVSAVTGLSAQEAVQVLETDLGMDSTADPASHVAGTEVGDVVIQIEAASGMWSFYIGGPWTG